MKQRRILSFVGILVGTISVLLVLRMPWETKAFFWWHLTHDEQANIGNLTIKIPKNWISVKKNKGITLARQPEESGLITVDHGKVTLENLKAKPVIFSDGKTVQYKKFEPVKFHNSGFLAQAEVNNNMIDAVISFPNNDFYFSFVGTPEAFNEFLGIVENATPRKW